MPKLRPLKPRELVHILDSLGFRFIRQAGSHAFFRHPDGRTTMVPMHHGEEIRTHLLRKILRDIKVEPRDFIELYER